MRPEDEGPAEPTGNLYDDLAELDDHLVELVDDQDDSTEDNDTDTGAAGAA
jgi:hypothetical protein